MSGPLPARAATLLGAAAIAMWSWLSVLAVATGQIPPFQLAAMTFVVGACIGPLLIWIRTGRWPRLPRVPLAAWLVGVGGLFGYHALYFIALRLAPPAEAGLLNYFWPLLIVLFSALLPGERLKAHHLVGVGLGLVGTVLLFAGQGGANFSVAFVPGFAAALAAAFVWAGYSVLSRRLKAVPTDAVAGFCLATAILAALAHVVIEKTVWPAGAGQWLAVLALGVAPVGLAFYAWDVGMKHGDIRVLGAAAYATPVLSTALLVVAGFAAPSLSLAAAALLIAGGGLVAAKDMLTKQS
jgi:drug/metabolite transporter (DMT)-like permease